MIYWFLSVQLDLVQQKYLENGMSQDQVDKMMEISKKWMTPAMMFFMTVLSFTFWSLVISLITSIFVKKETNPFENNMKGVE